MTSLSLQDWGAIGEVVGGVAVLGSLAYLAVQIRLNTKQIARSIDTTRYAAFERSVASGNQFRELLILHPELTDLFLRGLDGFSELGGAERFRFNMLMRNLFSEFHSAYVRQNTWKSDPQGFSGSEKLLDWFLTKPGVREWLARTDADWRPEFQAFVEERLIATRPASPQD